MNDMTIYWIWLQLCLGSGAKVDEAIAYFGNPKAIYQSGHAEKVYSNAFSAQQLKKLTGKSLDEAHQILLECEKIGCGIITPDSERYPKSLMCMNNYPLVLYTLGNIDCLKDKLAISIVGTRKASDSGLEIAGRLGASLSRANVAVVSGGAFGIDSAAHLGVLSQKGCTVAVLGCGFNSKYRDGIVDFRQDIIENGAIISEYPPSTEAKGMYFPIRNRIIAALGKGTVVVEAAVKSGSLITANLALEYGRDIFAVPGNAADLKQMGTINLIRDGATPVFSSLDILGQYLLDSEELINRDEAESDLLYQNAEKIDFSKIRYGVKRIVQKVPVLSEKELEKIPPANETDEKKQEEITKNLSDNAKKILEAFENDTVSVDEIKEYTGFSMPAVLAGLTQLEISGIIKSQPGHNYKKII